MRQLAVFLILSLLASGCTAYKSQYVPFKPPDQYANHVEASGVSIGCQAYPSKGAAKKAFGFDIRGAGLLPVMLVLDNHSGETVEIVASQSFLIDNAGNFWQVLPNNIAFERLEKSTQFAAFFGRGAGKGAVIGAAAGGLLATALGIVSGNNVGTYLGKGAAVGGAGGAVLGGSSEGGSTEREQMISTDVRQKGLEGKSVPDQYLANGFLFFPGEAKSARALRLQLRFGEDGTLHKLTLPLGGPMI
jgi:hypothetical protein